MRDPSDETDRVVANEQRDLIVSAPEITPGLLVDEDEAVFAGEDVCEVLFAFLSELLVLSLISIGRPRPALVSRRGSARSLRSTSRPLLITHGRSIFGLRGGKSTESGRSLTATTMAPPTSRSLSLRRDRASTLHRLFSW